VTKLHEIAADWRKWSSNQLAAGYSTSAMIIDMCADELAAALAEQGWRSMDTAPRDGTRVLLAFWHTGSKDWSAEVGYWHEAKSPNGITGWYPSAWAKRPDLWQPLDLPPPPGGGS
jgi:hypothetical protein